MRKAYATFKNSATFVAHCCCSIELEFPCQQNTELPDCNTKKLKGFKDVATCNKKYNVIEAKKYYCLDFTLAYTHNRTNKYR